MLTYVIGNLFESPAQVIVNTVNTVGVMGKGIAKDFKTIYPDMFKEYQKHCETGQLTIGKLWLYKTPFKWILNFPTKTTWKQPSKVEYIEEGLKAFARGYYAKKITSIAFPALGCGNGELNWETQVRPLMEKYLKPLPIEIFLYLYDRDANVPEHRDIKKISEWLRSEPESMSFHEVWDDLKAIADKKKTFISFYGKIPFGLDSSRDENGEFLRIILNGEHNKIYSDEVLELWDVIRSYGFVFPSVVPPAVDSYRDYLLALFSILPYCREIHIAKNYSDLKPLAARGLQFLPRAVSPSSLFGKKFEQLTAA